MNETKLTAGIYTPLLVSFKRQLNELCLKRDAFLNHMIRIETPRLAEEMSGLRQSKQARQFISRGLKSLGKETVNIVVDQDVADALNMVVLESNMVRDAFLNRLIMFLRSSDELLSTLDLPKLILRSEFKSIYEDMPTSPMGTLNSVFSDPLYYLRLAIEERYETGIYQLELPENLLPFSCYLPDSSVPETPEYEADLEESDRLLNELELSGSINNMRTEK